MLFINEILIILTNKMLSKSREHHIVTVRPIIYSVNLESRL